MKPEPIFLTKYVFDDKTKKIVPLSSLDFRQKEYELFNLWHSLDGLFEEAGKELLKGPKFKGVKLEMADKIKEGTDEKYIILLLVKSKNLTESSFYDALMSSKLRPFIHPKDKDKEQDDRYFPILTICFTDITSLHTEEREGLGQRERDWNEAAYKTFNIDPRVKFLDSSIWNRFAPITSPYKPPIQFKETFKDILEDLLFYYQKGLYYSIASNTMLEFQMRMFVNSYIAKYNERGHSSLVTPFKFHSESQMKRKAEQEIAFLRKKWNGDSLIEKLEWRMLIVDDQASNPISVFEDKAEEVKTTKKELIRLPLDQLYLGEGLDPEKMLIVDSPPDAHLYAEKEADMEENEPEKDDFQSVLNYAYDQLRERAYDIIFLDYLLGLKEGSDTEREYGFHFLLELLEDNRSRSSSTSPKNEPEFKYDYSGRYWIFPISSFPHALPDKLVQLGISHLHEIWHISQGGDPISSPHLYAYNLYRFIKQRVSQYFLYPSAFRVFLNKAIIHCQDEDNQTWINTLQGSIRSLKEKMNSLDDIHYDPFLTSRFINSIKWFLKTQKKQFFNHLLDTIESLLKESTQGCNEKEIKKLQKKLTSIKKEYNDSLSILIRKIKDHREQKLKIAELRINEIAKLKGEQLNLSNLNLETVPDSIVKVERLVELDLSNNCLSTLPDSLLENKFLKTIDLRNNRFSKFPLVLSKFEDLKTIRLDYNFIKSFPPEEEIEKFGISLTSQIEKKEPEKELKPILNTTKRDRLFISYSRMDMFWLEKIKSPHLDGLKKLGINFEFWDDNTINAGESWREEIQKALASTKVALLLISGHFLNSEFIKEEELPLFYKAQKKGELTIVPFHISPSLVELSPEINNIQSFNDPKNPLTTMESNEQEKMIIKLIRHLIKLMQE